MLSIVSFVTPFFAAVLAVSDGALPPQDESAEELVSQYVAEKDYQRRRTMLETIQKHGPAAATATARALSRERPVEERRLLVSLLAGIRAEGVAEELAAIVRREEDRSARSYAIRGLADHGDTGFTELAGLLDDDLVSYERDLVAETLVRTGRPQVSELLVRELRAEVREVRGTGLIRILVHHDAETAVQLLPRLLSRASPINQGRIVLQLASLVEHLPPSRVKPVRSALLAARKNLLRALGSSNRTAQREAARALGALGNAAAIEPLREACEETSDEAMLWALARLDPTGSRDLFLEALEQEKDASRKTRAPTALRGLGRTGDAKLVEVVLAWLQAGERVSAQAAVEALPQAPHCLDRRQSRRSARWRRRPSGCGACARAMPTA